MYRSCFAGSLNAKELPPPPRCGTAADLRLLQPVQGSRVCLGGADAAPATAEAAAPASDLGILPEPRAPCGPHAGRPPSCLSRIALRPSPACQRAAVIGMDNPPPQPFVVVLLRAADFLLPFAPLKKKKKKHGKRPIAPVGQDIKRCDADVPKRGALLIGSCRF